MSAPEDPLWRHRHSIVGIGCAVALSVPLAALCGSALGAAAGDSYGSRVAVYAGLLVYLIVGAGVLFARVARHETRPVSVSRVVRWLASIWLWPLLLLATRR